MCKKGCAECSRVRKVGNTASLYYVPSYNRLIGRFLNRQEQALFPLYKLR